MCEEQGGCLKVQHVPELCFLCTQFLPLVYHTTGKEETDVLPMQVSVLIKCVIDGLALSCREPLLSVTRFGH